MAATATFTADFTKWDAALKNATAQLKSFEIPVKSVRAQLERMASGFSGAQIHKEASLAVAAVEKIGGAAKLTNAELQRFGNTINEAVQKAQRLGQAVPKAFADAQKEIEKAQSKLNSINFTALGERATRLGLVMSAAITVPIVGAAAAAIKFSSDFGKTMTQVITLSGVSEKNMQAFREEILRMAPAVGRGPVELAKALLVVTSTGIRGKEALEILEQSAKASAVGLGDTATVARAVTAAINSYGKENLSAAQATDILFRTVKAGGAEATELAPVLGRVTGVAAKLGVSFKEVGTFIATFTRLGVNASEAVTSLGGVMSTLLKPSKEAEKTLHLLGTSMSQLREEVKNKGLTQAMLDLVNATGATDDQLAVIIPNIRALRGVLGTAGAQAENFKKVLAEVGDDMDTANKAFERGQGTIARTFDQLSAQAQALAIRIGDGLAPALSAVLKLLTPFLDILIDIAKAFSELPQPLQYIVIGFVGLLAALGPVIFAIGRLAQAIAAVQVIVGAGGLTAALGNASLALGAVSVAVGAAAVAFLLLEQNTSESVEAAKAGNATWEDIPSILLNAVSRGLVPFGAAWRDITQGIHDAQNAYDVFTASVKDTSKLPNVKAPKLAIPDASGPGLKDFGETSRGLNDIYNELGQTLKHTAEDGFEKLRKATADAKAELALLSKGQIQELRAGLKSGAIDTKGLEEALHGNEVAARMFQAQMQETNKELKKDDARIAAAGLKELAQDLSDAEKAGLTSVEILDKYGNTIKDLTFAAKQNNLVIPEMVENWNDLRDKSILDKALHELELFSAGLEKLDKKKFLDSIDKSAKNLAKNVDKYFDQMVKSHDEAEDAIAARTLTATEFQIRQIEEQRQAQIRALGKSDNSELYRKAVEEINRAAEELTQNLQHQGIIRLVNEKRTLRETVEADKTALDDMLAYNQAIDAGLIQGEKFTNEEIKRMKRKLREDLKAVDKQIGQDWKQLVHEALVDNFKQSAARVPDIIIDALLHGASLKQTIGALGTEFGGALGGAIGAGFGPLGAAIGKSIGSLLGPLISKFFKTDGERAMSEIGKEWGVTISEQMGKQIEETMKTKFKGLKNNRWAAEVFNLSAIIDDIGGITSENIGKLEVQLRQAFNFLHDGIFNAGDVAKVLDESFGKFTEFYTSRNAFISKGLLDIIKLDKEMGVNSKAVADFVEQQANRATQGFNKIAQNFLFLVTGFKTGSDDIKELMKEIDKALESGKKGKFAPEFIEDLKKGLATIGPIVQATFGALIEGGASIVEAISQLAPGLEQIKKILEATGVSAQGFFGQILGWQNIIDKNKELFEILSGVDDALKGLHNSGALTQESFSSLADIVSDAFGTLQRQGVSASDALALMQPQLQELWELQQDFGYAVDEATQKLLDQAEAAGVVGDAHRSVEEQMLVATERVADAAEYLASVFGYQIPEALGKTADAAKGATDDIIAGFDDGYDAVENFKNRLPDDISIPIDFPVEDVKLPDLPREIKIPVRFDPKNSEDIDRLRAQTYAMGGYVKPLYAAGGMFVSRGTDTVPAMLTPGEFVVNKRAVNSLGLATMNQINSGKMGGGWTNQPAPVTNYFTIQAWDGEDVVRVLTTDPRVQKAIGTSAMRGVEMGGDAAARFDRRAKRAK